MRDREHKAIIILSWPITVTDSSDQTIFHERRVTDKIPVGSEDVKSKTFLNQRYQ